MDTPAAHARTVLFGHGIWFAMLIWRLLGFSSTSSDAMTAFRRFQTSLPMPNCAVYELSSTEGNRWAIRADEDVARTITRTRAAAAT